MAQQFQVPQFIDREARLVGPFTIKQTAILVGGGSVLAIFWFILEKWLFFLIGVPFVMLLLFIIFVKINGRPILDFFVSFFSFFTAPQLYIWQKRQKQELLGKKRKRKEKIESFSGPTTEVTKRGIRDLAKKLDV